MSGEETLQSKLVYDRIVTLHDVKTKQYCYSNNGQFGEKEFRDACEAQGQKLPSVVLVPIIRMG
eukprot:8527693-Ditylum_brightwellii.AAC.1